jgi:hypothetical protein
MGQDRHSALALLSIEAESAQVANLLSALHVQRLAGKLSAEEK